jgi:membrane protein required for colicin V production
VTVDLIVLGALLLFGVLGGLAGAAKQIAQVLGMVAAYASARPLGTLFGPQLARELGTPELLGVIATTLLVFIAVLVIVRILLTALLQRILSGKDPADRGLDRGLGFALGAAKVGFICYLVLSGLAFVEEHVSLAGKKLGITPKGSMAFALARRYNFFELTQFGGVRDLAALSRASADPERLKQLQASAQFQALQKDPRMKKVLQDPHLRKAAETGDYPALLKSDAVLQLLQDPTIAQRLAELAAQSR